MGRKMQVLDLLADEFGEEVRRRGRSYQATGRVTLTKAQWGDVRAKVRGTSTYAVRVYWEDDLDDLTYSCTCPYYDDHGVCKHIWATILEAQEQEVLPQSVDDEGLEDELEADAIGTSRPLPPMRSRASKPKAKSKPKPPAWRTKLSALRQAMETHSYNRQQPQPLPAGRQIVYVVDLAASLQSGLTLEVCWRKALKDGNWDQPKRARISQEQLPFVGDPVDRQLIQMFTGTGEAYTYGWSYGGYYGGAPGLRDRYLIQPHQYEDLFRPICQTVRCLLRGVDEYQQPRYTPILWDDGPPWEFRVALTAPVEGQGTDYRLDGFLERGEQRMALSEPLILLRGGLLIAHDHAARMRDHDAFEWIGMLRQAGSLPVPAGQLDEFLGQLFQVPRMPRVKLPEGIQVQEVREAPRPRVRIKAPPKTGYSTNLRAELLFDYAGHTVSERDPQVLYRPEQRQVLYRDPMAERAAEEKMREVGFKWQWAYSADTSGQVPQLPPKKLPGVVATLMREGWQVEAEGKLYRQPGEFSISVSSGIDWFDLEGKMSFGEQSADLPELLAALKSGQNYVQLGDGTLGMLPEDWTRKYQMLAGLGSVEEDHLRFMRSQAGLLDALLAAEPQATFDEGFDRVRRELREFEGVRPLDAPATFQGQLRGYQQDGLGWFGFLRRFGFGGCLADDMGLGKTVQVLAMLEARRNGSASPSSNGNGQQRDEEVAHRPSLVVAPRSLIFNWRAEAARFCPQLRVLDHTGQQRSKQCEDFGQYDLILTTYGTLRKDAAQFRDVRFDYVILDESQAVKNVQTQSAKAVRLLHGRYRLALSGTPVENHLGELWSLFDFLNPGMLGSASVFKATGGATRKIDSETVQLLAKALRPFILRRTKEQVAKELPEKTEQTIYCELEGRQRKQYDELRDHYRRSLLSHVDAVGLNRSKIQVLEALLRLRQAACHPGLVDKTRADDPSAKLDALLPQLAEVVEEGHKVLVFSQFTSLLAIVRQRLEEQKIPYEYLDGQTRDRQGRVERFQNDPSCKLFLISLKAGGLGLNLTAAEYVFLLDPWWNPAVEAQAIDRAHRIGQTRRVFAYRLIAKDTVEEKVLQLQQTKRDLADAIISADNSLIRQLNREDLELLLS